MVIIIGTIAPWNTNTNSATNKPISVTYQVSWADFSLILMNLSSFSLISCRCAISGLFFSKIKPIASSAVAALPTPALKPIRRPGKPGKPGKIHFLRGSSCLRPFCLRNSASRFFKQSHPNLNVKWAFHFKYNTGTKTCQAHFPWNKVVGRGTAGSSKYWKCFKK